MECLPSYVEPVFAASFTAIHTGVLRAGGGAACCLVVLESGGRVGRSGVGVVGVRAESVWWETAGAGAIGAAQLADRAFLIDQDTEPST